MASRRNLTYSGPEGSIFENDFWKAYARCIDEWSLEDAEYCARRLLCEKKISADEYEMIKARPYRRQRSMNLCYLVSTKDDYQESEGERLLETFRACKDEVISMLTSEMTLACARHLFSLSVICTAELEAIVHERPRYGARHLCDIIEKKGGWGIREFVHVLSKMDQSGQVIAEKVQRKADELGHGELRRYLLESLPPSYESLTGQVTTSPLEATLIEQATTRRPVEAILEELTPAEFHNVVYFLLQWGLLNHEELFELLGNEKAEHLVAYLWKKMNTNQSCARALGDALGIHARQHYAEFMEALSHQETGSKGKTSATEQDTQALEKIEKSLKEIVILQLKVVVADLGRRGKLTVEEIKEIVDVQRTRDCDISAKLMKFAKDKGKTFTEALSASVDAIKEESIYWVSTTLLQSAELPSVSSNPTDEASTGCKVAELQGNDDTLTSVEQPAPFASEKGQSKSMASTTTTSSETELQCAFTKSELPLERLQYAISRFRDILVQGLTWSHVTEIVNGNLKETLSDSEKDEIKAKSTAKEAANCLLDIAQKRTDLFYDFYAALPKMSRGLVTLAMHYPSRGEEQTQLVHQPGEDQTEITLEPDIITPEEVKKLVQAIPHGMRRIKAQTGSFSYSFGKNMELTVYIGENTTIRTDLLEAELKEFLRAHISERFVKVFIEPKSYIPELCTGFAGSTIFVRNQSMTLGVYLQYGSEETIYWVSCAHALNPPFPHPTNQRLGADSSTSMFKTGNPRVKLSLYDTNGTNYVVDSSISYVCLNYGTVDLAGGVIMDHPVDIMIGSIPCTERHLRYPQQDEMMRCDERRTRDDVQSFGRGLPEPFVEMPIYQFDFYGSLLNLQKIRGKTVFSLACDTWPMGNGGHDVATVMHTGTVVDPYADSFHGELMILIQPGHDDSGAQLGHSGSVWFVAKNDDNHNEGFLALAITCARVKKNQRWCWLASPLCASLQALSSEYPLRFPSSELFKVLHVLFPAFPFERPRARC